MINNTSIGKQMYKQKKKHGRGLEGLVVHYIPHDRIFGVTANLKDFTDFCNSNSSGKVRVWIMDVLVLKLDPLLNGVFLGSFAEKCSNTFPSDAFQNCAHSQPPGTSAGTGKLSNAFFFFSRSMEQGEAVSGTKHQWEWWLQCRHGASSMSTAWHIWLH